MIDVDVSTESVELVALQLDKAASEYRSKLFLLAKEIGRNFETWSKQRLDYNEKLARKWRKTISILEDAVAKMKKVNRRD